MKNMRSVVMLVIALLAGLAAVVLAAKWIQQQGQNSGNKIAVAVLDIQLGSRLSPEMIQMVEWPASSVPPGAFTDEKVLVDRVVKTTVTRGEPVLESKLAPVGSRGGLSAVVGEGKRAITVRVNDVIGVAGFALPGNYVDIMVSTQEEGAKGNDKDRTISKIVLEHILVLAVAQEAGRDETKPKVVNAVTLEVTPDQAEKLDLARSVGTLSLVLRNQTDMEPIRTAGATKDSLFVKTPMPPPAVTATPVPTKATKRAAPRRIAKPAAGKECVVVIRGANKTTECF
ncbi:Flp pilus assembly protein CpaB [Propionivibrio limicola]|uniref:Flp pilus assembly protein CpaB n=1 Tax=Propionivibrio limicola TaxID=167645 RepID=UPI0012919B8A|nr:Flp pilus assembly protein CpaB [Propionivibrio limicola]